MSKYTWAILTVLAVCIYASSDTPHCEKDAVNFGKCLAGEYHDHKDTVDKALDKVWQRVGKCFTDNDCKAPTSDDKFLHGLKFLKQAWHGLPQDARACIASVNGKMTLQIVNACLKEQKVDEIPEPEVEEQDLDEFANQTLPHHRVARGLQEVIVALKKCRSDKGAKSANATLGCMVTIKQDMKEEVCKVVHKCRKDKVSDTCHQKGQKVHEALCACGKTHLQAFIKTVGDLEEKGKDLKPDEVLDHFGGSRKKDQKEIADNIKKCFKENQVKLDGPEPDGMIDGIAGFLVASAMDPTGPSHGVLLALAHDSEKYTKKDFGEIRQILVDISHNFDCGCTELS